jgi:hypothetical protein
VSQQDFASLPLSERSVRAHAGLKSLGGGPEKPEQDASSDFMRALTPDKLPEPWFADSEYLLKELARIRELALHVPLHNDTVLPTNTVVDAIWRLEQQLRYLLHLHREGQRAFAKKSKSVPPKTAGAGNLIPYSSKKKAG